ncbi:hypothetical protein TRSC58_06810 [Trypanosoma rangeli SC58]|uniref:Uncharacterized protein n=1 Tax=Trypanosoma rangeli SC58 TaxID=429131 RepID=A0A061IWY9_TRYRA|nr:hypothetical protein TRSC58_06810 [Trypanosoma rangeli SC58]
MLLFCRHPSQFAWLLMVIVVAVCCGCGCLAASLPYACSFDRVMRGGGRLTSAPVVVREVPLKQQDGSLAHKVAGKEGWAPIRIVVSTEDLKDDKKYCHSERSSRPDPTGRRVRRLHI